MYKESIWESVFLKQRIEKERKAMSELMNERFEEVVEYVAGLRFHKTLLGVNESEVYEAMKQLDEYYQELAILLEKQIQEQIQEYENVVRKKEMETERQLQEALTIKEIYRRNQEKVMLLEEEIARTNSQGEQYQRQKDDLAVFFADVHKEKEVMVREAQEKAYNIVENAKRTAQQMRREKEDELRTKEMEERRILERLRTAKEKAIDNLKGLCAEINDINNTFGEIEGILEVTTEKVPYKRYSI